MARYPPGPSPTVPYYDSSGQGTGFDKPTMGRARGSLLAQYSSDYRSNSCSSLQSEVADVRESDVICQRTPFRQPSSSRINSGTQTPESERQLIGAALQELYQALGGEGWKNNNNWLRPGSDVAHWHGLSMTDGDLVSLNLICNDLQGELPEGIGGLVTVQEINLSYNQGLCGRIPQALGAMPNLRVLHLYSSSLYGPIPESLSRLTNLEELWLNSNRLTGPIPPGLGALVRLRELYLNSNELTGVVPDSFSQLRALQGLNLSWNRLSGGLADCLGHMRNLKLLSVEGNDLEECPPAAHGPALTKYMDRKRRRHTASQKARLAEELRVREEEVRLLNEALHLSQLRIRELETQVQNPAAPPVAVQPAPPPRAASFSRSAPAELIDLPPPLPDAHGDVVAKKPTKSQSLEMLALEHSRRAPERERPHQWPSPTGEATVPAALKRHWRPPSLPSNSSASSPDVTPPPTIAPPKLKAQLSTPKTPKVPWGSAKTVTNWVSARLSPQSAPDWQQRKAVATYLTAGDPPTLRQALQGLASPPFTADVFRDFASAQLLEENVDFYLAVDDFRAAPDVEVVGSALALRDKYIRAGGEMEVNISSAVRQETVADLEKFVQLLLQEEVKLDSDEYAEVLRLTRGVFDRAQQQIFDLLASDAYPRFVSAVHTALSGFADGRPLTSGDLQLVRAYVDSKRKAGKGRSPEVVDAPRMSQSGQALQQGSGSKLTPANGQQGRAPRSGSILGALRDG